LSLGRNWEHDALFLNPYRIVYTANQKFRFYELMYLKALFLRGGVEGGVGGGALKIIDNDESNIETSLFGMKTNIIISVCVCFRRFTFLVIWHFCKIICL